jgi:GNAT superfamily N-acetyltransferase
MLNGGFAPCLISVNPYIESMVDSPQAAAATFVIVPIRSLGPGHRDRIVAHLLALDGDDRYLRFGYLATDEHIAAYVAGLDFDRDDIFGIYNRKLELIAMAHLAFSAQAEHSSCAEFGVSVSKKARGRGYGSRLFERAVMHARNEGVEMMFIHALTENKAMLKIARNAGATLDSLMSEMVDEQVARTDYRLKAQAHSFREFLASVQDIRRGVRDGRHKSAG